MGEKKVNREKGERDGWKERKKREEGKECNG